MTVVAHYLAGIVACHLVALNWGRTHWMWRAPRAAIVWWQAIGLATGLCAIGAPLALGLAPYRAGTGTALLHFGADLAGGRLPAGMGPGRLVAVGVGLALTGVLLGTTAGCLVGSIRVRRRHRQVLDLVARRDPAVPGALVLDHPGTAAYCLPGLRPRVVVSAGTLRLLDAGQLAAVLSHERAHADERHDLVLLPFAALRRLLPWAGWARAADTVALLVEMRADDAARRRHADAPLAAALLRFAAAPGRVSPSGSLGAADDGPDGQDDGQVAARIARLDGQPRPVRLAGAVALSVAGALVSLPLVLFLH